MTNPPSRRPWKRCVRRRKALAFPFEVFPIPGAQAASVAAFPSLKNTEWLSLRNVERTDCPCREPDRAALTMVPISSKRASPQFRMRLHQHPCHIIAERHAPRLPTSKECVRRLCTKMLPGKGNTCVLFCKRRNGSRR